MISLSKHENLCLIAEIGEQMECWYPEYGWSSTNAISYSFMRKHPKHLMSNPVDALAKAFGYYWVSFRCIN